MLYYSIFHFHLSWIHDKSKTRKMSQLKKKKYCYKGVQYLEHCRDYSCSGIIIKEIHKGKRWRRFVLFIIMCPKLWNPVTTLGLLKLWGMRKQGQEVQRKQPTHLAEILTWLAGGTAAPLDQSLPGRTGDWSQGVGVWTTWQIAQHCKEIE